MKAAVLREFGAPLELDEMPSESVPAGPYARQSR